MSAISTPSRAPAPQADRLYFHAGIPGFPQAKTFSLRPWGKGPTPFSVLESQDVGGLCFVTVDPAVFFPWYEPQFGAEVYQALDVDDEPDLNVEGGASTRGGASASGAGGAGADRPAGGNHYLQVLVILTLHSKPEQTTANLLGPIVLNPGTGRAVQAVLSGSGFDPQTPVTKKP